VLEEADVNVSGGAYISDGGVEERPGITLYTFTSDGSNDSLYRRMSSIVNALPPEIQEEAGNSEVLGDLCGGNSMADELGWASHTSRGADVIKIRHYVDRSGNHRMQLVMHD